MPSYWHLARSGKTFIVLQPARNAVIRPRIVQRDPIKLARGNTVKMFSFCPSETLINASVGPEEQPSANRRLGRLVFVSGLTGLGVGRFPVEWQGHDNPCTGEIFQFFPAIETSTAIPST